MLEVHQHQREPPTFQLVSSVKSTGLPRNSSRSWEKSVVALGAVPEPAVPRPSGKPTRCLNRSLPLQRQSQVHIEQHAQGLSAGTDFPAPPHPLHARPAKDGACRRIELLVLPQVSTLNTLGTVASERRSRVSQARLCRYCCGQCDWTNRQDAQSRDAANCSNAALRSSRPSAT